MTLPKSSSRPVISWVLIVVVPLALAILWGSLLVFLPPELMAEIIKGHFLAVVGVPGAAVVAAFIVVALQQAAGPVKFEGLGFKFEGSSGQVVLWVVCFLAIVIALRVLW